MSPYTPTAGTVPGLAPYAETLPLCSCDECRPRRHRGPAQSFNVRGVPDAALWREIQRRAH